MILVKGQNVLCLEEQDEEWYRGQIIDEQVDPNTGLIFYLVHFHGWNQNWESWVTNASLRPDYLEQSHNELVTFDDTGLDDPMIFEYFVGPEMPGPSEQPHLANQATLHISVHGGNAHIKIFDETEEQNKPKSEGQKQKNDKPGNLTQ